MRLWLIDSYKPLILFIKLTDGRSWLHSLSLWVLLEQVDLVIGWLPRHVGHRLSTDVVVLVCQLLINGPADLVQGRVVDVVTTLETVNGAIVQLHSYIYVRENIRV